LRRQIESVQQQLRAIPDRGMGYGLLRYLSADEQLRRRLHSPAPEISFNYLGQFDQTLQPDGLFGPARESTGPSHSPRGTRSYVLEINSQVVGGQLLAHWSYSPNLHHPATIERLANSFIRVVQDIVLLAKTYVDSPNRVDLASLRLSPRQLETIVGTVGRHSGHR